MSGSRTGIGQCHVRKKQTNTDTHKNLKSGGQKSTENKENEASPRAKEQLITLFEMRVK